MKIIFEIAKQEFVINTRNKWTLIFTIIFGILVLGISYSGLLAEGFSGIQNFSRTSASLLNLTLYIIPLIALVMGTLSFTSDKGSMELLFSQPISRKQILFGKLLGLFATIFFSTAVGFGSSAILIALETDFSGFAKYISFVFLILLLSIIFLILAAFVAIVSFRKLKAFGTVLFIWFFFELFYDILVIGGTVLLKGQTANTFVFISLFGNPVDLVRVGSLIVLDNPTIFGAAGAQLLRFFGGEFFSFVILIFTLSVWCLIPLFIASKKLAKQDI